MICSVFHPIFMKRSRRKIWRRKLTIEMIYYKIKYQHHNRFLTHNHSQNLVQEVHILWIRLFSKYYIVNNSYPFLVIYFANIFSCFKFIAFTCVTLHGSIYVYKVYTGIHNLREMWSYFYYWLHKSIVYQKIHTSRDTLGSTIVWHWRKPMQGPENRTR